MAQAIHTNVNHKIHQTHHSEPKIQQNTNNSPIMGSMLLQETNKRPFKLHTTFICYTLQYLLSKCYTTSIHTNVNHETHQTHRSEPKIQQKHTKYKCLYPI